MLGIQFEKLSALECAERWPQINFEGVVVECLRTRVRLSCARRGCEAVLERFLKEGGQYIDRRKPFLVRIAVAIVWTESVLRRGKTLEADAYVFAPGPWLGKVFPFLAT